MGKKKGPRQKGEAMQIPFGGGSYSTDNAPAAQPQRQKHAYVEKEETKGPISRDNEPVDFGAENARGTKRYQNQQQQNQPPPQQHRQVQYQSKATAEQVQPAFMADAYDRRGGDNNSYGGQRQERSAYQAREERNNNYGGGGNRQGGGRGQGGNQKGQHYNEDRGHGGGQQRGPGGKGRAQGGGGPSGQGGQAPAKQEIKEANRLHGPKIDDGVKEQIRSEYAEFDIELSEESKLLTIEEAKTRIYSMFSQLEDNLSISKATPVPSVEISFGAEAVQPLQPPLYFNLGEYQRNFEAQIGPWRLQRDQLTAQMLLKEAGQVKSDIFDEIFKFDLDELKRKAACDCLRNDEILQAEVSERVNEELRVIEAGLSKSSFVELSEIRLEQKAEINVASGRLESFSFSEPKEPFELEPDFDGNPKEIMAQLKLDDELEIDQLLENAADPFGEVPEDDETQSDALISKFLGDLRDLGVLQQHQEKYKEVQKLEKDAAGYKAQQLIQKQKGGADSEGEEEESKEPLDVDDVRQATIDYTGAVQPDDVTEATMDDSSAEMGEIDSILDESYAKAVSDRQRQGLNGSRLQAEPSHFHLATLEQERARRPLKKATDLQPNTEEEKQENWVVTDTISMKNFEQLVQDPAIVHPFELDDFQKRAVYRLEQGNCVMVAAHTSAGKTLVAEYAIALSRRHMTKTIYTSPIKSLSNQKYRDFKLKFGDVGMLTGDVQLNKDASCLIMTTEILQQMLYNDSSRIADVEWVIFDEVHYINDEQRGSVWEEVIIKLPDTVSIVMLSATVPNYLEFAQWVGRVKQKKIYVQYTQKRPVPLQHSSMIDGRMFTLKEQEQAVNRDAVIMSTKKRAMLRNNPPQEKPQNKKKKEDDQQQQKKIDFKGKAIKHKENAVKKAISRTMKSSGGKGPDTGAGQKSVSGKKKSNFEKTLLSIQQQNLLPSIVFTFSRAGTSQYAEDLDPQIDFTDGYTKGLIKKFIKQKIQRLDAADRDLPQIQLLTKLMVRGIGIHHAGLLQILKELVEILFSDGYLKVVFATSTFAIGLNLPARSVIFTGLKKFDGTDFGTISTSEYLQMAGRAGRRGKDDCGFSILCMDPGHQVPPNSDLIELLESKGIELASKLNVNYDMCLNSLKQDSEEFGAMLKNSFFANESATVKIQARQKKKRIEPVVARANDLQCVYGAQDQIQVLFDLVDTLWDANEELSGKSTPIPLSIVQVVTEKHLFKDAVVLRSGYNKHSQCMVAVFWPSGDSMPVTYEEDNPQGDFESAVNHAHTNVVQIPGSKGENLAYECLEISNCMITETYAEHIQTLSEKQMHFIRKAQLADKQIKLIAQEYHSLIGQLTVEPLGGTNKKKSKAKSQSLIAKRDEILNQIRQTKCWNCAQVSYHLTQLDVQHKLKAESAELDKVLQGNVDEKEAEFNNRNAILTHYKIIDEDLNILFKGKVAMQACQDKVLLTEFFFSGFINDLTDPELLAILSVFVTTEKAGGSVEECVKHYSEKFSAAIEFVEKQANALIQLEQDMGVVEEQELSKRLNFKFYELIYDWADQKTFMDVVGESKIDEGSVIKMTMAVNRTRQAIEKMAVVVGDNALVSRMQEMEPLINRGIVKMQSLYLEVEQEPQKLNREEDVALPESAFAV